MPNFKQFRPIELCPKISGQNFKRFQIWDKVFVQSNKLQLDFGNPGIELDLKEALKIARFIKNTAL